MIRTSWDNHFMLPDFMAFVHWALGHPETLAAYRMATGDQSAPSTKSSEESANRGAGVDDDFLQRFSGWVEENLFGRPEDLDAEEDAP